MKIFSNYHLKLLSISAFSILLMHCSNTITGVKPQDVKPTNTHTSSYRIKATKEIPDTKFGLTGEYQTNNGKGQQYLHADDYRTGGEGVPSKILVRRPEDNAQYEYSLTTASVALKWNIFNSSRFGVNSYFGLAQIDDRIDVSGSRGFAYRFDHSGVGGFSKVEVYLPFANKFRLSCGVAHSVWEKLNYSLFAESVSLDYQLLESMRLSLSYQYLQYNRPTSYSANKTNY
jgi:hypothetical protein